MDCFASLAMTMSKTSHVRPHRRRPRNHKPISSPIRNAYIDFTKMTTSLVAVVTDAVRDGKRVVGYGFNSNGRYGQGGLIRERFAPRLLEADPKSLLDATATISIRTRSGRR